MKVDLSDALIVTGAGMVLAGAWLIAGLPAVLLIGGLLLLLAGLVRARATNRRAGR